MNLQAVKARLPLWGVVLLLPLLALAFYLNQEYLNHQQSPSAHGQISQPIQPRMSEPAPVTKKRDELPQMGISPTTLPAESSLPSGDSPTAPVLDLDAARQAVFRKENAVYDKATRLFDAEPVDVDWATGYEQSLRDMFTSHAGLMRVSVNTISCHTSMCRIEVFTPRDTDADYFTGMFYNALDNFREGTLKAEAAIARRMEVGMTSVYIARKGHDLGFY